MKDLNLSTSSFSDFFKFLLKVFVVTSLTGLLLDYLFTQMVILNSDGGPAKVNKIMTKTQVDEIPILGSSRAEGSYVPDFLGESFFNYGLAGTHPLVWMFLLKEELKKNKSAPVIINFDLEGFGDNIGDVSNYILNYPETALILKGESSFKYFIPFVRYFGHYDKLIKYRLNESMNLTKKTNKGGSFYLKSWKKEKREEMMLERISTPAEFIINIEQKSELFSIIRSTDRNIIFVVAPYHSSYLSNFKNINEVYKLLKMLDAERNVHVFDFSALSLNEDYFYNTSHVNYNGGVFFSSVLRDSLDCHNLIE